MLNKNSFIGSATIILLVILFLRAASLLQPFWLNMAAIHVARTAVVSAETSDQTRSDISGQELAYARELLAGHQVNSSGGIAYQALIAYLAAPPDAKASILENIVSTSGEEVRPFVKFWLGEAYLERGDYLKALSLWTEIGAAQRLLELGDRLSAAGRWTEAAQAYEASLRNLGSDVRVYWRLGHALQQLGRQDDALRVYERSLTVDPRNYAGYIAVGNVYRERGMFDEAQAWFDRAVQETGDLEWAYIASAKAYEMQGAYDLAEARLRAVLQEYPGNCEAWGQIGLVLWRQGIYDEAITALEKAAILCPQVPWMLQALGNARRDSGDIEAARQAYEAVLNMDPTNTYAQEQLDSLGQMLPPDRRK